MNGYFRFIPVVSARVVSTLRPSALLTVLIASLLLPPTRLASGSGMEGPELATLRDTLVGLVTDPPNDSCYTRYPDSLLTSPFNKVFALYVTDGVLNGTTGPGWSAAQFDSFTTAILDADSTTSHDVFPVVWDYFCYADEAAAEDSVYFNGHDRIEIAAYHAWNFVSEALPSYGEDHFYCDTLVIGSPESKMLGRADTNTVGLAVNGKTLTTCGFHRENALRSPDYAARNGVFAHELQHLIDSANLGSHAPMGGGRGEFRATAAEYVGGIRWTDPGYRRMARVNDGLYDVVGEDNARAPFNLFRLFHGYLFAHFSGDTTDATDDLIYRTERGGKLGSLEGFAEVLGDDFASEFPGMTDPEIAQAVYQRFAIARFADDTTGVAGGIYGFGSTGVSPRSFGWFEWLESCNTPRVDWVPPDVTLGLFDAPTTITTWTDTVDTVLVNFSRDLELETYGSEYLIVRADSTVIGSSREMEFRVQGLEITPADHDVVIGYLEYPEAGGALFEQNLHEVTEAVTTSHASGYLDTTIRVEGFGDSTEAVVLVVSMVESAFAGSGDWQEESLPISITYEMVPDTTRVPFDEDFIQDAIDGIAVGGVVAVEGQVLDYKETVTLKNGVRLVGVDEGLGLPVLNGETASTTVAFPENAAGYTVIEGFVIKGGTEQIVKLRGAGTIESCALDGTSTDPTYGVRSDTTDAGATVSNCSILLDSGTGIWVNGGAVAVSGCDVRVLDGSSGNKGIETSASGGVGTYSVTRNLVRVPGGTGIVGAAAGTAISQCTVDSVDVGFAVSAGSVDRCIASAFSSAGFIGNVATSSIADESGASPYGSGDGAKGSGSVVEDPLYCDRDGGEFTRRFDGYMALGAHAGAFPGSCAYGRTVRAVVLSTPDTTEVIGDLVLAYDLEAKNGAVLRMAANDDAYDAGSDTSRVEIILNGAVTLKAGDSNADGAVFMGSSSSEDAWAGIRSPEDGTPNQAGKVNLLKSVIKNAVVGVRLDSVATKSTIDECTFVSNQSRDVRAYIENNQSPMLDVVDCSFTVGGGTGIELEGDSETVLIENCTFTGVPLV